MAGRPPHLQRDVSVPGGTICTNAGIPAVKIIHFITKLVEYVKRKTMRYNFRKTQIGNFAACETKSSFFRFSHYFHFIFITNIRTSAAPSYAFVLMPPSVFHLTFQYPFQCADVQKANEDPSVLKCGGRLGRVTERGDR